ncbi:MAG: hypothetical protein AAB884_01945, partial [Patescibacteria group bacterium]
MADASTQQFVQIKKIERGVVYLKNGSLRRVLIVGGVNFDLKSENEQTLILNSFQNFLNTLDFSVQFFIHSRKVNVSAYLAKIAARKKDEENELLKIQIEEYVNFIKSFVEENAIISKTFFVVVPYEPVAIAAKASGILSVFRGGKTKESRESAAREGLEQLNHRVDQTTSGLSQIGLRVMP